MSGTPFGRTGVSDGTVQKNGSESRERNDGDREAIVKEIDAPSTRMPLTCRASPARNRSSPARSDRKWAPGVSSARVLETARSTENRTSAAVTTAFDGGANRLPARTVNVKVLPSFDTRGSAAARSGRSAFAECAGSEKARSVE